MSNKKLKDFNVYFEVNVSTSISIKAESLEDAISKARTMGVTDVVEIPGEHIDSSMELTGVYQ